VREPRTVPELAEALRGAEVPTSAYSLLDGDRDEAVVLDTDGRGWNVHYSERGLRTGERRFATEGEACAEVLRRLGRWFPAVPPPERYFLSSLESTTFAPVRSCVVKKHLRFDTGKEAILATIDPPAVGQLWGLRDDVETVVLASRHEGQALDPITSFPCFVHIATPRHGWTELATPIRADDLHHLAWGELYRTADDAEHHRFD